MLNLSYSYRNVCGNVPIIIHPELKKLKHKLSDLILEHQELEFQICPCLEREYIFSFGFIEYNLYEKDVRLSILKRKLRLIQIQINNNEPIDMDLINEILKEEFSQYRRNIKLQMDELEKAMKDKLKKTLSKEDTKRLKLIYKQCVLKLHPDLNKNLSEREKNLFIRITEAFKNADLKALESLYYLIPHGEVESMLEMDRLQELIDYKKREIAEIKNEYPYNKKELVCDDEKKQAYITELRNLISQFDSEIQRYNEKINDLI